MRLFSTLYYFGLILIGFLLAGCKASEKVVSKTETSLVVNHRMVPVIIPERKASIAGLLHVDDNGHISLQHINIVNDQGVKVDATVTPDGKLLVDFVAPKDTTSVAATDTSISVKLLNEKETEREPSIFQRLGAVIGWSAFGTFIIIGLFVFLRYKIKRLWQ